MTEENKAIIEGLAKAIMTEIDGYIFYSMAQKNVRDEKGKEMFSMLADEELAHRKFLEAQYKSIVDNGDLNKQIDLPDRHTWSHNYPIFSKAIIKRLDDAHFEMSALSIGIQLELSSEQYYRTQAKNSQNQDLADMYLKLANWESAHYHALIEQYNTLKDEYWTANGFAPF
jgi:rubrerythrin